MAKPQHTHTTSTVVDVPLETVWAEIRDIVKFAGIVLGSAAENLGWAGRSSVDRVPAQFSFNLPGGETMIEELVGRSDIDHCFQYRATGQVLQMIEYTAEVRLQRVTLPADRTFITYSRTFVLAPGTTEEQLGVLLGIMDAEMVALRDHFKRRPAA